MSSIWPHQDILGMPAFQWSLYACIEHILPSVVRLQQTQEWQREGGKHWWEIYPVEAVCLILFFLFLLLFLDYQKIQAQFRWETRTNCLNGNHYAAHDSAPPHYLQKGDTLMPGGPHLPARVRSGVSCTESSSSLGAQHGTPQSCLRSPWGCGAACPVENVTQMFL